MDQFLSKLQKTIRRIAVLILGSLTLFNQGFATLASSDSTVEGTLKELSYEEKFLIKRFFYSLLRNDGLGHVLFFDTKPACFGTIDKQCRQKSYSQRVLLRGWKCWKNSQHLFSHPNFIFIEEEFSFGNETVFHIFIINKKTLLYSIYKNIDLFRKTLGADFSPENFITSIEKEGVLRPLLKHDEALFGVILGYGVESSIAFKEQHKRIGEDDWAPEWTANYTGIEAFCPKKCRIHPVEFVGNPESKEVADLLNCYTQELEEIWRMYTSSKDILRLVLKRLCEE